MQTAQPLDLSNRSLRRQVLECGDGVFGVTALGPGGLVSEEIRISHWWPGEVVHDGGTAKHAKHAKERSDATLLPASLSRIPRIPRSILQYRRSNNWAQAARQSGDSADSVAARHKLPRRSTVTSEPRGASGVRSVHRRLFVERPRSSAATPQGAARPPSPASRPQLEGAFNIRFIL